MQPRLALRGQHSVVVSVAGLRAGELGLHTLRVSGGGHSLPGTGEYGHTAILCLNKPRQRLPLSS